MAGGKALVGVAGAPLRVPPSGLRLALSGDVEAARQAARPVSGRLLHHALGADPRGVQDETRARGELVPVALPPRGGLPEPLAGREQSRVPLAEVDRLMGRRDEFRTRGQDRLGEVVARDVAHVLREVKRQMRRARRGDLIEQVDEQLGCC
ncbi:hypothetical protein ACIQ6Y_31040 [Streptomyces sp. NPDC096205]|uniref:hypothetical protein n=1 Tax=Streptomyces sp. NPDC096205 TaxID=3366081 RepID=UPI003802657E